MAACLSVLPASQSPIYFRTAILVQNEQEPSMESPADHFNRKLTNKKVTCMKRTAQSSDESV